MSPRTLTTTTPAGRTSTKRPGALFFQGWPIKRDMPKESEREAPALEYDYADEEWSRHQWRGLRR